MAEFSEKELRERDGPKNLAEIAQELFGPENGIDLELPDRVLPHEPPDFSDDGFAPPT